MESVPGIHTDHLGCGNDRGHHGHVDRSPDHDHAESPCEESSHHGYVEEKVCDDEENDDQLVHAHAHGRNQIAMKQMEVYGPTR